MMYYIVGVPLTEQITNNAPIMIAGAWKSILLNRDFQIDYSDWTKGKC